MTSRSALQLCSLLCWFGACSDDASSTKATTTGSSGHVSGPAAQGGAVAAVSGSSGTAASALISNVSRFPGSGTGNNGAALSGGLICDAKIKTRYQRLITPETKCMKAMGKDHLAATLERVLECVDGKDTVHLRLTLDPGFVDNTYGTGSIGWPHKRGHTLVRDLTKSDHAELTVISSTGATSLRFKLDYISELASAPSGFGSLGVRGGDGAMLVGDADFIVQWNTSISRNLNERGYGSYTVNSPATDSKYTPNPQAPEWDYRVVYEAWIDVAAFGGAEFGDASISFVHASPAKGGDDTLNVEPGDCPPPFCQPDDPKCAGYGGTGGSSSQCGPDDPQCTGQGGIGGVGGSSSQCGPDDPQCTGQGGIGGSGGATADCPPDAPECFRTGGVAGAPEKLPEPTCPPDQPSCSPE
jgi:hypothetical protein